MYSYKLFFIFGSLVLCYSLPSRRYLEKDYPLLNDIELQDRLYSDPEYFPRYKDDRILNSQFSKRSGYEKRRYRTWNDLIARLRALAGNNIYHTGRATHLRFGAGDRLYSDPEYFPRYKDDRTLNSQFSKRSDYEKRRYRTWNDLIARLRALTGNNIYHTGRATQLRFGAGG